MSMVRNLQLHPTWKPETAKSKKSSPSWWHRARSWVQQASPKYHELCTNWQNVICNRIWTSLDTTATI